MRSAYDVLGLDQSASDDDVRGAYRRFSKVLHPDINKRKTATQEFKDLKTAYETLIDPSKRQEHNYALAVVETKDVEKDAVDDVLESYSLEPKRKKKKKKKKEKEVQVQVQPQAYSPPPYIPPQQPVYNDSRRGRGQFEGIPGGFEDFDNLGGIL